MVLKKLREKTDATFRMLQNLLAWIRTPLADTVGFLLRWFNHLFTRNEPIKYTGTNRIFDLQIAKSILKVRDKQEAIFKRSIANERLKTTFLVENPFTTTDTDVHETCVREIQDLVKFTYETEKKMIDNIFKTEKNIFLKMNGEKIAFKKYVMITTMKFSIKRFFPEIGDPQISEEQYSKLCLKAAEYITSLWIGSKSGSVKESDKKILFDILQNIFPQKNMEDNIDNPLGKILPTFETIWRVLLRLCFTLKFSDKKYMELIKLFGKNPGKETYTEIKNDISVENIVKEILFLNPPTRTIYRKDENNNDVGIDVLTIHKNYTEDKNHFFPERWAKKNNLPFFTFGYGGLSCPARKYAPIILGLMGAAVFETFQEYDWNIDPEYFSCDAEINDRNKYPDFDLLRKI